MLNHNQIYYKKITTKNQYVVRYDMNTLDKHFTEDWPPLMCKLHYLIWQYFKFLCLVIWLVNYVENQKNKTLIVCNGKMSLELWIK